MRFAMAIVLCALATAATAEDPRLAPSSAAERQVKERAPASPATRAVSDADHPGEATLWPADRTEEGTE